MSDSHLLFEFIMLLYQGIKKEVISVQVQFYTLLSYFTMGF